MSDPAPIRITRRRLPHITRDHATYFVTFRLLQGELLEAERDIVLQHIRAGDQKFYCLIAVVVMPDHVHAIFRPIPKYTLSQIMKGMKGVSARLINQHRKTTGSLWQDESYDRVIRSEDELIEKVNYIIENPVRSGLVARAEDYFYTYWAAW